MIKDVLTSIEGVGIYGVISICIFFTVFVIAGIWMMSLKKDKLNSLSELPLNDGSVSSSKIQSQN